MSVGTDHDIRRWWRTMGQPLYPRGAATADQGRCRGLQRLPGPPLEGRATEAADETGLEVAVCHLPPGTSKWNKIEHRLFSAISQNWRRKPLISHEVVVNLIGATTAVRGLKVQSALDIADYPAGRTVTEREFASLYLRRDSFHGEWNYALLPRTALPVLS